MVRYNAEAPLWYWGFKQMPEGELISMMDTLRSVLFLDGPDAHLPAAVQDVLYWYPELPTRKFLQVWHGLKLMLLLGRLRVSGHSHVQDTVGQHL